MKKLLGIVVLLLIAGCSVTMDPSNPEKKALADTKARIRQYQVIKTDLQLTLEILKLQTEIAQVKANAQKRPVIEGDFVPLDKVPAATK